jgi:hypothetical protein
MVGLGAGMDDGTVVTTLSHVETTLGVVVVHVQQTIPCVLGDCRRQVLQEHTLCRGAAIAGRCAHLTTGQVGSGRLCLGHRVTSYRKPRFFCLIGQHPRRGSR